MQTTLTNIQGDLSVRYPKLRVQPQTSTLPRPCSSASPPANRPLKGGTLVVTVHTYIALVDPPAPRITQEGGCSSAIFAILSADFVDSYYPALVE
jgi:hypothetical protein